MKYPKCFVEEKCCFQKHWHIGRSLALSTHILEVKVKVPSEVAVEDSRITDGRHHGCCPDLNIVCSLVTTIYYPQSRPSPILDISRTAAATCHPLQLMFCQDLRISPCCRIFCKTTLQNRCWLFTRCHVSRGSVSRVTSPHSPVSWDLWWTEGRVWDLSML